MSEPSNNKVIIVSPQDATLKVSDITEKIISGILDTVNLMSSESETPYFWFAQR
jgi:hypothetical protein